MTVRRVEIEVVAAYDDVIGIRCFEDRDTTRTKHPQHFIQQHRQRIEREMLDDMKSGDGPGTLVRHVLQILKQILFGDVEVTRPTLFDLKPVAVYAACLYA